MKTIVSIETVLCNKLVEHNVNAKEVCDLTKAVCVVMRVPPAAPVASWTFPSPSSTRVGHMDDIGILPGTMKLLGDAGTP